MPKKVEELSALVVSRLTAPGFHAVGGVAGLHLSISGTGARSWVLRIMVGGKRRDMGLGGFPDVTLAQAREKAREKRAMVAEGIDPIEARRVAQSRLIADSLTAITFESAAKDYIKAHSPGWRNAKHGAQWRSTLENYAYPKIGAVLVRDVALTHVLAILEPIWTEKTETASRLRGRIESVLDWATARGYREGLNPARWRGHLDKLLPNKGKIAKVDHHPALSADDLPAFMKDLRNREGIAARALEFAILTATRSGEVRGALWPEFDLDGATWTIPGNRMKAGKDHRVPLSPAAVTLLRALPRIVGSATVFQAPRGGVLSDMALTAVMRRMGASAVPHGFRSTFRDWASERTNYPRDVAEMALAHTIGDKVEAAYRRGDLFEKRRRMMEEWAKFCEAPAKAGEVVPIKGRRAKSAA